MASITWRIVSIIIIIYSFIGGLMFDVPKLPILNETVRNLYFHVPTWFAMLYMLGYSMVHSIIYLRKNNIINDLEADESAKVGMLFGILGMVTGMLWAQYTWGAFWSGDPKQNASAIGLMMYAAYFVLRNSFADIYLRAKVSAVYNILCFMILIPLLFVLPRLTDSLHPGNGGNPGFNAYDLDNRMRLIFYPAIVGWCMFGMWLCKAGIKIELLNNEYDQKN
ncbi:MAG: cytochrome c biogenesis protein [Cytophagales bacterium]|nr:cytochrome c biogenesis protein [Cytophagales bacterium]